MAGKTFISDEEMSKLEAQSANPQSSDVVSQPVSNNSKIISDAEMRQLESSTSTNPPTYLSAATHGLLQGVSSDFGEELAGSVDPAAKQRIEASQAYAPDVYGTFNTIGSVLQGLALPVAKGAKLILQGAGLGGLSALGKSDKQNLEQAASDTAQGALFGGLMTHIGSKFLNAVGTPLFGPKTKELSQQATNSIRQGVTNGLSQLSTMATSGAAANLLLTQPESWEDAKEAAQTGALYGVGLGLTGKAGISLFKGTTSAIKNAVLKVREKDIELAQKTLNLADENIGLAETALKNSKIDKTQAIDNLAKLDDSISIYKNQIDRASSVIADEPLIASKVATLPDDIVSTLDSGLKGQDGVGGMIQKAVQNLSGEINLADDVSSALSKIDNQKAFTITNLQAKKAAEKAIKSLEAGADLSKEVNDSILKGLNTPQKSIYSPGALREAKQQIQDLLSNKNFLAKKAAEKAINFLNAGTDLSKGANDPFLKELNVPKSPIYSPVALWEAKQQIQDLLYNKDFLASAKGTNLRKTLIEFESGIRNKLNKLDPTGELAELNTAYSKLIKAKEHALDSFTPSFFKRAAVSPNDPSVKAVMQSFESNFNDLDKAIKHPYLKAYVKAMTDDIGVKSSTALENYSTLREVQKQYPKLTSALERANKAKEEAILRFSGFDDAISQKQQAVKGSVLSKEKAANSLNKLQNPELSLPVVGTINNKLNLASEGLRELATTGKAGKVMKVLYDKKGLPVSQGVTNLYLESRKNR